MIQFENMRPSWMMCHLNDEPRNQDLFRNIDFKWEKCRDSFIHSQKYWKALMCSFSFLLFQSRELLRNNGNPILNCLTILSWIFSEFWGSNIGWLWPLQLFLSCFYFWRWTLFKNDGFTDHQWLQLILVYLFPHCFRIFTTARLCCIINHSTLR